MVRCLYSRPCQQSASGAQEVKAFLYGAGGLIWTNAGTRYLPPKQKPSITGKGSLVDITSPDEQKCINLFNCAFI